MSPAPKKPRTPRGVTPVERKRRDGTKYWRFRVQWTPPGQPRRSELYDRVEDAEARTIELRALRQAGAIVNVDRGAALLGEWFEREYFPSANHLEAKTADYYAKTWNLRLAPTIGHVPLRKLDGPTITRMLNGQKARSNGKWTTEQAGVDVRRKVLTVLSACLTHAVRNGELAANPCHNLRAVPVARRKGVIHCARPTEVEAIRAELNLPHHRLLITLIAYVGLRPEEALALSDEQIDGNVLLIDRRNVNGEILAEDKRHKVRSVEMPGPVRKELAEYRLQRPGGVKDGLIFFRPSDGEPWTEQNYRSWRKQSFRRSVKAAGSRVEKPYDLRHACASLMLLDGQSVIEVAAHMGHTVQVLSDIYAHPIKVARSTRAIPLEKQIADARANPPKRRKSA